MGYGYNNGEVFIDLEWSFDSGGDDEFHELPSCIQDLLVHFKDQLCEDLMICDEDFAESTSGMSMTHDKILHVSVKYTPVDGCMIRIHKRICKICKKTCGLSSTYCDGTGKATETCQDCGKTQAESLHRDGCSWNRPKNLKL